MKQTRTSLYILLWAGILLLLWSQQIAVAQKLPPPSRTVYKCVEDGRSFYSDAPCLGANRIEVEPSRGFNKSTGREKVGNDVRNEQWRETLADAIRPITGTTAKQNEIAGRRSKLPPESQRECRAMDSLLPQLEALERTATGDGLKDVQAKLLTLRSRARRLGC